MRPQQSAENYLETILMLSQKENHVHSVDIANALGYSKPSVSVAMKNLKANDYITVDSNGHIFLTESGRKIAQNVYDCHTLISDWLIFLGVDEETAANDACGMEHSISEKSFLALKKHLEEWKKTAADV